ncbi:MAG TPA: membrane protein insertase YidC [Actinomycetales bacterium]|jgi:YidC/Oxa1 family membrane protein insertase
MSPYDLLDPAVTLAHSLLVTLADAVPEPTGGVAVALAVVALTLLVRAAMLPLAVAGVRADRARRALAPELARIRHRCGTDRERLTAETLAAYRAAGVSPLVGVGPALLQVPVVSTLYRVVVASTVAGGPNLLVGMVVLGAPLTAHWPQLLASAGLVSAPAAAAVTVLVVLLLLARASAAQQAARAAEALADGAAPQPAAAARLISLLPYATVAVAVVTPVAVSLYLVTSTAWAITERAVLPRLF